MKLANVEAEENFKIKTLKVFKIQVKNDHLTREELKYLTFCINLEQQIEKKIQSFLNSSRR